MKKKNLKAIKQARLSRKHKRAVAYIRFSSNMQREGYSIEYQKEQALYYIESQGYTFVRVYIDEAKTAKKTAGRDAFFEMMNDVEQDMFDVIVVFSFNRAFRNTRDALNCHFEIYTNHGIVLESITERVDMTSPHGKASATSLFAMHELSSEITAEHVKAGMRYAVQQGYYTGGKVPFGYVTYETGEKSRYAMKQKFKIDESNAENVKEIFNLAKNGMGGYSISRYMYDKGVRKLNGDRLTPEVIRKILSNRFYIGEAVYNFVGYEQLVVSGKHPAIIDKDTFEAVQKGVQSRRNKPKPRMQKDNYYPFALTGMIYCGKCGAKMQGFSTRDIYKYYKCNKRKHPTYCDCKYIRCQTLESEVLKAIREHILNDESIKTIAGSIIPMIGENDIKKRRDELTHREAELKNAIKDLVKQKQKGIITEDILDELSEEYTNELNNVQTTLNGLHNPVEIMPEDVERYLYSFMGGTAGEGTHERYLLFNALVDKVVINDDVAEIHLCVSSFPHNEAFGGSIPPLYSMSENIDVAMVEADRRNQNRKN